MAWLCQAVRAPGANRTRPTTIRWPSAWGLAMTSNHTSPVNCSGGFFTVGGFGRICIVLLSWIRAQWSGSVRAATVIPVWCCLDLTGCGHHGNAHERQAPRLRMSASPEADLDGLTDSEPANTEIV